MHPALLVGRSSADVELANIGQKNDAAITTIRQALAEWKEPSAFDIQTEHSFDLRVLRHNAADVTGAAAESFIERQVIDAARIGDDDSVIVTTLHIDDAQRTQTRTESRRLVLNTHVPAPHVHLTVGVQSHPVSQKMSINRDREHWLHFLVRKTNP